MTEQEFNQTYRVETRPFSTGGYADIYKGIHRRLNMEVIFKMLRHDGDQEQMLHEVEVLKRVAHQCLPRVLDAIALNNAFYSVIEYIPGRTLAQEIETNGPVSFPILMRWSRDLCEALNVLHTATDAYGNLSPVIHADIKPDNIIIRAQTGRPVLIDFNISATSDNARLQGLSPSFSPPELIQAFQNIRAGFAPGWAPDQRTDLYSLGTVLYFAACGRLYSYEHPDFNPLRARGISPAYIQWLKYLLHPNHGARYPSAARALQALNRVTDIDAQVLRIQNSRSRRTVLLSIILCLGLACAGLGAWMVITQRSQSVAEITENWQRDISKGDFEAASEEADRLGHREPSSLNTKRIQAETEFAQGNYGKSAQILNDGVFRNGSMEKEPQYRDALKMLADSYERIGQTMQARDVYEELDSCDLLNAADCRDYAALLTESGQYDQANAILKKGQDQGLGEEDVSYIQARNNWNAGNKDKGISLMLSVIQPSTSQDLLLRAGRTAAIWQISNNKPDGAVKTLETVIGLLGETSAGPEYYRLLAQAKMNQSAKTGSDTDIDAALNAVDQIIEKQWDTLDVWNSKAALESALGKYDLARISVMHMEEIYGVSRTSATRRALIEYDAAQAKRSKNPADYTDFAEALEKAQNTKGDENSADYQYLLEKAAELKKKGLIS